MSKKRLFPRLIWPLFLMVFLIVPISIAHATTVGLFTGGDVGEGLDLDGTFIYAVNVLGGDAGPVRDANFLSESNSPGATVTAVRQILNWANPSFGATTNDNNLETVMRSIRWSAISEPPVKIDLANLFPTANYRLQLFFTESCCNNREFDVTAEGSLIAHLLMSSLQGPADASPANGVVLTHDFTAVDSVLNITLAGLDPIISGFTLEQVATPVPEPGLVILMGLGLVCLFSMRRRSHQNM